MRLVEVLSKVPDPWYGDNITAIYQDNNNQYWKLWYNDVSGIDSPWTKKVKVYNLTKTIKVSEWVEYY